MNLRSLVVAFGLALVSLGCAGENEDPILRLSAEESMEQGRALFEQGKYASAREYFQHAFEVEPNSALGREALLLVADTLFEHGGSQNYIKSEAKYRDFQNRFPTSDRSAYVQFRIAASLEKRMRPPDRDQSISLQALEAFEDVIQTFPTSEFAAQASDRISAVRNRLAESEFLKGRFNQKLGLHKAAMRRYEFLLEEYNDYTEQDKVLFYLIESLDELEEVDKAAAARERLRTDYPDSVYLAEVSG